jgi:acetyl esterase/lipase
VIQPRKRTRDLTPVHPDLRKAWRRFPKFPFNRWTLRPIRWLMDLMPPLNTSDNIHISSTLAQSGDSNLSVKLRIYQPEGIAQPVPALLWMHGGGFIVGNSKMEDAYLTKFVKELGIVVVSVDYRLAPDHPYPAAIDDCYAALRWVHTQARSLQVDPDRIAIGGESAGGGLAASLAQLAYDRGEVSPVFQLLVYPMLDDRSALRDDLAYADAMIWTPKDNRFGWESYLQGPVGADTVPPYAVPARRDNLTGLPPAWIGVGTLDLFYKEDVEYAERLSRCGVDCELLVVDGAFHGFDRIDCNLPLVQDFRDTQVDALGSLTMTQNLSTGQGVC